MEDLSAETIIAAIKELIPPGTDLSKWNVSRVMEFLGEKFAKDLSSRKKEIKGYVVSHVASLEDAADSDSKDQKVPEAKSKNRGTVKVEEVAEAKSRKNEDSQKTFDDSSVSAVNVLEPYVRRKAAVKATKLNKRQADSFGSKSKTPNAEKGPSKPRKHI